MVYSNAEARVIAGGLRGIDVTAYPKGDVALLYDHAADFSATDQPLASACREDLEHLRAIYDSAALNGWGVKLLT
ncbi:MAG: hypothetical protein HY216_08040 [Candidatus Rokubacteria bacterium]|nr:hypothetical protein [Candidatus Rokubacteria bacterium]